MEPANRTDTGRNEDGTFKPGVSGNPSGRPKNTLKDYVSRKFQEMSDEDKEAWLKQNKVTGIDQWKMGEGNPATAIDADIKTQVIVTFDPNFNAPARQTSGDSTQ